MIYCTSDLHLNHDREFIWKTRGFNSVHEMNDTIVKNWNAIVNVDDDVYLLGDVMLGDNAIGLKLLKQLKGKIHIVAGNHDTETRRTLYKDCYNVVEVTDAIRLKYKGYNFYMTHWPCITGNLEKESLKQTLLGLFGHTHQTTNFYNDMPFMYHVGVDSHNCTPVSLDDIIMEMENKVEECKEFL